MANQFLSLRDVDFESNLANLREYLKSQDTFSDYDFDGSNISVLLEILAQNTYLMAFYLNMVGTESWIDSAELRESLVSRAKELNYTPRSAVSSRAVVDIEIVANDSPFQIVIPKGYAFRTPLSDKTTTFVTDQSIVLTPVDGRYIANNVTIFEGLYTSEVFTSVSTITDGQYSYENQFILESENVDTSSIEVEVVFANETTTRLFTKAENLFNLTPTSQTYFVEGFGKNQYRIAFGDGVLGVGIPNGSTVTVRYRDTVGSAANGTYVFAKTTAISGYSQIAATTRTSSYGGAARESIESIRYNAPRHFQVQYRTTVPSDYEIVLLSNFPEIQAVIAYGGEVEKLYGKMLIAVKTRGVNSTVSESLKTRMKNFLLSKNLTTEPLFVDPNYFLLSVDSTILYNLNLVTTNTSAIRAAVMSTINALNTNTFNKFGGDIHPSRIEKAIDESDGAIVSNSTTYKLVKRLYPEVNVTNSVIIDFNNSIYSENHGEVYPIGHRVGIESTKFNILVEDVITTVVIRDNGIGELHLYQISDGPSTSLTKLNTKVGTVDYDTGRVVLNFKPQGYEGQIDLMCSLNSRQIEITNNMFVSIDSELVTLTMVADNE